MKSLLLPFSKDRLSLKSRSQVERYSGYFVFAPLTKIVPLKIEEPEVASFTLFTSQNAVSSVQVQSWFGSKWSGIQAYTVGDKTRSSALKAGLNVVESFDPPAVSSLSELPLKSGIWFSGEDVAEPLDKRLSRLNRISVYRVVPDLEGQARAENSLKNGEIAAALVTSERVASELISLGHIPPVVAALSERLKRYVNQNCPGTRVNLVSTFELCIDWYLDSVLT